MAKRWAFIPAYWRFNLAILLEYRASFFSQAAAMVLNDIIWVAFWGLYFTRFPDIAGWGLQDVLSIWSLVAVAFALSTILAGNAVRLAGLIATGQLDFYLTLPKPVLPHVLVSRMSAFAWGDLVFGLAVFLVFVARSWTHVVAFVAAAAAAAVILTSFEVLAGSLAFFCGHAEQLAQRAHQALITFSTYPTGIFERPVRILLHTAVPAALVSTVPVTFVRSLSWVHLGLTLLAAAVMAGLAWGVFHVGLRRYESGNLLVMRS